MALICLPPSTAEKLKNAIRSGDIPFDSLFDMASADRHSLFAEHVSEGAAKLANATYDQAKLTGLKRAAADYVTASDKGSFAKTATQAEFAKKLLTDAQAKKMAIAKIDEKINTLQERQTNIAERLSKETEIEKQANLQLKLDKLKAEEQKLNVRKEDIQNPVADRMLSRINDAKNLLSPGAPDDMMTDLVSMKMGKEISPAQGKYIVDQSTKLQELAPKSDGTNTDKFGNPTLEYWEAHHELENYIESLTPSSFLKVFMQNIGRNMLLASLHTPIKAGLGDIVNTAFETVARRVAGNQYRSEIDMSKKLDYVKTSVKIYNKTGYNISTMLTPNDNNLFGEQKVSAQGPGAFNATARVVTDIVINKLHGLPFVATEAANFVDSAALEATKIAAKEGLKGEEKNTRANQIFDDSVSYQPKTEEGRAVRLKGQVDAKQATYVNKSLGARITSSIKDSLNSMLPGLGDWTIPIAKIPANVISRGIEVAGGGGVKAILDLRQAFEEAKKTGEKTDFKAPIKTLVSMGLGITSAYLIASQFKKDDFIGAYPTNPNEVDLLKLRGGIANSVKIGDHWVSLEYLGPLAPAVTGFMYAKKYGDGSFSTYVAQYLGGVGSGLLRLPGISQVQSALTYIANSGQGTLIDMTKTGQQLLTFAQSRTIPAIVLDAFKVFGPSAGTTNNFGSPTKDQPAAWQQFLFGSAVSLAHQGPILDELTRLSDTTNTTGITSVPNIPSLADISKDPKATILQTLLTPAKYTEAINQFKIAYRINIGKLMNNQIIDPKHPNKMLDYKSATDEQKIGMINTEKTTTLDAIMKAYGENPKAATTGKAVFEGNTSYAGKPTVANLTAGNAAQDQGRTNPKGEKYYTRLPLATTNAIRTSLYNSDPYWKDNGYTLADVQLDDVVPYEAGGGGTKDNLMLISKVSDQLNQKFEDFLGQKYAAGTISRANAIKASIDYKINKSITLTDVKNGKY